MNKQKVGIVPKIIMAIGMIIVFSVGILYYIEMSKGELSFFTEHFCMPIILIVTGCFAIYLPSVSQKSYQGEDRGDKMMIGVGLLLFLSAIIALVTSFI